MPDLTTELEAWCASYVAAFSDYDAAGIADHWLFPALITQQGRNIAFKNREHFDANTDGLLGFYKTRGVARAERRLLDALQLNDDTAAMKVADRMVSEAGAEIVSWQAAYVLRRLDGKWRAVMAAADGEVAAWAARGTPLGKG